MTNWYTQEIQVSVSDITVGANVGVLDDSGTQVNPATSDNQEAIKTAVEAVDHLTDGDAGSVSSATQRVVNAADIDLNNAAGAIKHSHTTGGTAEVLSDSNWSSGDTIMVIGHDTAVYVGPTASDAEANSMGMNAGTPFMVTMDSSDFHVDASTGSTVRAWPVTAP